MQAAWNPKLFGEDAIWAIVKHYLDQKFQCRVIYQLYYQLGTILDPCSQPSDRRQPRVALVAVPVGQPAPAGVVHTPLSILSDRIGPAQVTASVRWISTMRPHTGKPVADFGLHQRLYVGQSQAESITSIIPTNSGSFARQRLKQPMTKSRNGWRDTGRQDRASATDETA